MWEWKTAEDIVHYTQEDFDYAEATEQVWHDGSSLKTLQTLDLHEI